MSGISFALATAEHATAEALKALPPREWMVFQDVCWPGRRHTDIDHIAIGPSGVFGIDTLARPNGRLRESAVRGVAVAASQIAGLICSVPRILVTPVLCFWGDDESTGWAGEVRVCSAGNLAATLASRPVVLTPEQVRLVTLELDIVLREAVVPHPA